MRPAVFSGVVGSLAERARGVRLRKYRFKVQLGNAVIVGRIYREDIDWLRAIAVLAVVAFHFEAPAIYGGFVGVDIFFVISGYLITRIVQSEVQSDTFSFARFYERRVRRLLPALYTMVALMAIPSFHYLFDFGTPAVFSFGRGGRDLHI
jgi:peptidoglycan/LPS O-acetylase OafA/YrhL